MNSSQFPEERIQDAVSRVATYLREERELYVRHSEPLAIDLRARMQGYFPEALLSTLKTIILTGARIPPPPFYAEAREMSEGRFPDFVHIASVTYIDVIVFHDHIEPRPLFHGVVHATQMALLGFDRYVDLYVRGFVKNLSWLQIPLEDQAYKLDARFAENPGKIFSVEDEIRAWDEEGRYL